MILDLKPVKKSYYKHGNGIFTLYGPINKSKTMVSNPYSYLIPYARRYALARARNNKKCVECGWRLCTCDRTLDECF